MVVISVKILSTAFRKLTIDFKGEIGRYFPIQKRNFQ